MAHDPYSLLGPSERCTGVVELQFQQWVVRVMWFIGKHQKKQMSGDLVVKLVMLVLQFFILLLL